MIGGIRDAEKEEEVDRNSQRFARKKMGGLEEQGIVWACEKWLDTKRELLCAEEQERHAEDIHISNITVIIHL